MTKKMLEIAMFLPVPMLGLWGTHLFYPVAAGMLAPFSGGQWLVGMITLLAMAYAVWTTITMAVMCSGMFIGGFYLGMTSSLSMGALLAQVDDEPVTEKDYSY